ncbi:MAG: sn-glycerol-3-phosphate ABC transporter ATP-binding protein UgpC [bacterium]|nr:sn-glycerol-3-phosphate ABC transporter ATP-binding protein UgpC [bacterium]
MASLRFENVKKKYNGEYIVKGITFDIPDKSFFVIVGPSGCGKTTTLRMIAGLEDITEGSIYIDGKVVNNIPPKDRDVAFVFQNYALYPHMTVWDNIAFGLKLRGYSKEEIARRIEEVAAMLEISHLLNKKPKELSGGQRQRVAVGRAIVRKPKVFLFDEPLSNLDAKLRVQMRTELSKLHDRLQTTAVYVTHDQVEAMTMGDYICVMNDGLIEQIGTPIEIYNKPKTKFVAGFIGSPPMNFIDVQVVEKNNEIYLDEGSGLLKVPEALVDFVKDKVGSIYIMGIRPEDIYDKIYYNMPIEENVLKAKLDVVEMMGSEKYLYLNTKKNTITVKVAPYNEAMIGDEIDLVFNMHKIHLFDKSTLKALF